MRVNELKQSKDPWDHATASGRAYLTPEDITDAIDHGAKDRELWRVVLEALSDGSCENVKMCALVALEASS